MRELLHDLRYGARMVRKAPGFSLIVVLTLALAIGANTVIFSFTNVLLVRPLPIKDQDRLGWVFTFDPQRGNNRGPSSLTDYLDFRDSLRSFEALAATTQSTLTMTDRGDAIRLTANRVTVNLFDLWGIATLHGRGLIAGDDHPGAEPVVVLSHQFWKRQFAGDPSMVGQSLTLNGRPHRVVGVAARTIEFGNLATIDIWTPLTLDRSAPRDRRIYRMNGRLAAGVTLEQADAEVRATAKRLEQQYPDTNRGWAARVASTRESIASPDTWVILALLMTVVGFVLLIACANIANLVLARATGRRRELAVRTALGASRRRLVGQLLTESLALGLLGGAAGLGVAQLALIGIRAAAYEPFFDLVRIDGNVLVFTAVLGLAAPLLFSLVPAVRASRADVSEALKEGGARTGGASGRRSRSVLVVSQLTLAMALLIVSVLLVREMIALARAPLGFDPESVLSLQIEIPEWRYRSDASVLDYYDRLLAGVGALPGIESAAAVERLPVLGGEAVVPVDVGGFTPARPEDRPWAVLATATGSFFDVARIPVLAGRTFLARDSTDAAAVAVVNQHFARRYFSEPARAIGARVTVSPPGAPSRPAQIVGIVGDVKQPDLTGVSPAIYLHALQSPRRAMALMVRSPGAEALMPAVRGVVRSLDPDVAVFRMRTVEDALNEELSSSRIIIGMFVSFAVIALIMAAAGLYGVISYTVSQRVQEIGIRMALGAVSGDIRRLVARQIIVLVAVGAALGLAGGAAIARAARSVLSSVSPSDPVTYAAVAVTLVSIAVLASYVPLRRATRVDPLTALRTE